MMYGRYLYFSSNCDFLDMVLEFYARDRDNQNKKEHSNRIKIKRNKVGYNKLKLFYRKTDKSFKPPVKYASWRGSR